MPESQRKTFEQSNPDVLAASRFEVVHNCTVFDRHHPISEMQDEIKVLLHKQDRVAAALEFNQRMLDLPDDDRCQSLGGFIEKKRLRARTQDPADGEHLLLAAAELVAVVASPCAKIREQREDIGLGHARGADYWRKGKILIDGEAGEDRPLLGAIADAEPRTLIWAHSACFAPRQDNAAGLSRQ